MSLRLFRFLSVCLLCGSPVLAMADSEWSTIDGQSVTAEVVDFDFETKILTLENSETSSRSTIQTKELQQRGKFKMLFQPAFHAALNGRTPEISAARRYLLCVFAFTPAILMFGGFWIAGWLVGGRANPFRALFGFFGSWITGTILMLCYFMLSARTGGSSGVLWFGAILAAIFVSVFVSAVYNCKVIKGLAIFIAHLVATVLLGAILLFACERLLPAGPVDEALSNYLYRPAGVIKK